MNLTEDQEKTLQELVPVIVSRDEWKALKPTSRRTLKNPVEKVVFVHSQSNPCYSKDECINAVKNLQNNHMEYQDKSDIDHNFLIGRDGTVLEGRGWHSSPALIDGEDPDELSGQSLEIAFIGFEVLRPTKYQLKAALGLLISGIKNKYISEKVAVFQFGFEDPIFSGAEEKTTEDEVQEWQKGFEEAWDAMDEEEKEKLIIMDKELGKMNIADM